MNTDEKPGIEAVALLSVAIRAIRGQKTGCVAQEA
jgi:hypothetical protein